MHQTASAKQGLMLPEREIAGYSCRALERLRRSLRQSAPWMPMLAVLFFLLAVAPSLLHAQTPMDLGMTYTQQRSKFVGSSPSDYFYLRGATVDLAYYPFHGFGPVVSFNGLAVTNLRGQIDIHQASFLGGGRYTFNLGHISPTLWSRRGGIFAEALVGVTDATDGEYPSGNSLASSAFGYTYALGGGINYNIYHRFELRLMSHYFVTDLPNGGSKQQKNIQVSVGVNWHFGN